MDKNRTSRCGGGDRLLQTAIDRKVWWKLKLLSGWSVVAGPLAHRVIIERIEGERLVLAARHPAYAHELMFQKNRLLVKIEQFLGGDYITELSVKGLQPVRRTRLVRNNHSRERMVTSDPVTLSEQERAALKVIDNRKLSQHMASFYQQCKRRASQLRSPLDQRR